MTNAELLRILLLVGIPFAIVSLALTVVALVGILKKKVPASDKILWCAIVVLVDIIGPILYFAIGSNQLDQKVLEIESRKTEATYQ